MSSWYNCSGWEGVKHQITFLFITSYILEIEMHQTLGIPPLSNQKCHKDLGVYKNSTTPICNTERKDYVEREKCWSSIKQNRREKKKCPFLNGMVIKDTGFFLNLFFTYVVTHHHLISVTVCFNLTTDLLIRHSSRFWQILSLFLLVCSHAPGICSDMERDVPNKQGSLFLGSPGSQQLFTLVHSSHIL